MRRKLICLVSLVSLLAMPLTSAAEDIDPNLVAWWNFDDGSGIIAADSSGSGHDGTLFGNPEWVAGFLGGALEFDGADDAVSVPYSAALNPPDSFTVSAWAKVASRGTGHRAVISSRDAYPLVLSGYIIYAEPGNTWQFWIGKCPTWYKVQGPSVHLNEWSHLAGVYSGGTQQFYVDGKFVGQVSANLSVNHTQDFLIGAGANGTTTHQFLFVGKIDEVRVYNRALSTTTL